MPAPHDAALVVIPSRWASRRLEGKPLADLDGQPMVWRVVERAREAGVGEVVVATDDARILDAVRARGGAAVMTSTRWRNGSERVAEVARGRPESALVIDLQGDEPLMDPGVLVAVVDHMRERPAVPVGTAVVPLAKGDMERPSVVKAELDGTGLALGFWRDPADQVVAGGPVYRHLGIYAYRREALLRYAELPPSPLEMERSLEQLRAMENGMAITAVRLAARGVSVDTEDDLAAARRQLAARG